MWGVPRLRWQRSWMWMKCTEGKDGDKPLGTPKFEGLEKGKRNGSRRVRVLCELCPGSQGKRSLRKEAAIL